MKAPAVLCSFLLILISTITCFAQSEFSAAPPPHSESLKREWKFGWEASFRSKVETGNKAELIESPVNAYRARFKNFSTTREYTLETTAGFTTKRSHNDQYFNFRAEASQKITDKSAITGDLEFTFTGFRSLGRTGIEVSKKFHKEQYQLKPYSRVDYYFPLGNGFRNRPYIYDLHSPATERFHPGFTWASGLASEVNYKSTIWENKTQLIFDTGAVISGGRSLFNTEVAAGYRFDKICIGPMFEYTRVLNYHSGHFPKNSFVGGMFIRYN
ncbi:hypothetical protein IPM19_00930 [bacterium]|nr:MAG: hypothetical protein IPM19_00930 [bacterium]